MRDILVSAFRELRRRKLRTLVNTAGYFCGSAFIAAIVLMLQFDLQAKNSVVNYMGSKFLAYSPLSLPVENDKQAGMPLDAKNEGFFTEPTVTTQLLPVSLAGQISGIPEVKSVTPFLLYRFKQGQDGHIFSVGGIRPADRRALRATVVSTDDIVSGAFFRPEDRNVVMVDQSYAELWNLKVGSVVAIGDTIYPIIGIASSHARTARADIYMNWPDAEAAINKRLVRPLQNEANIFLVEAVGAEQTAMAMQKVERLLEQGLTNAVICSLPVVKFMGMGHNTLKFVLALVSVLILLFAVNTQWTAVSERRNDIAILKAIGWGDKSIFGQIIAESLLVATVGGIAGALTAYLAFAVATANLGIRANPAYVVVNAPATIFGIILASIFVGMLSGLGPAFKAVKTSPAEVLRSL